MRQSFAEHAGKEEDDQHREDNHAKHEDVVAQENLALPHCQLIYLPQGFQFIMAN